MAGIGHADATANQLSIFPHFRLISSLFFKSGQEFPEEDLVSGLFSI